MGLCIISKPNKMRRQDYYNQEQPQKPQHPLAQPLAQLQIQGNMVQDVESNVQDIVEQTTPQINQSYRILQSQKVIMGNHFQKQNLNVSQILMDDVCKECNKYISEGQKVVIRPCKHLYDINCFTNHFKEHITCCTNDKIIINEAQYPKAQVNEIMKHKLKQLIENIKNNIVVQCPTQFCSFLFIYSKEYNKNQKKKFYCHRCQQEMLYDAKMCKFINLQTVCNDNNINDAQIYLKLETKTFGCSIQDHWMLTNIQITLPCKHEWCRKCLFIYYKDCLKAICHCGKPYNTSILKERSISNEVEWNDIYDRQLQFIMQESKLCWQFCKNNCGFFFEYKNMDENSYCINCDDIKTCNKCNKEVLSYYIQVNQCKHYYHLLCSFDLLIENSLKNLNCLCGQKLDNDIKIQMNIICIICQKYDDNLIMFQCCHFIHQECLEKKLLAFSSFRCIICLIPIDNIIYEPKLLSIRDKLIQMKEQSNNYKNQLFKTDFVIQNKQGVDIVSNQQQKKYHNQQVNINNNYGYK